MRTVSALLAAVRAGTTMPALGWSRAVCTSLDAQPGGRIVSLLQKATYGARATARPWFMPVAKPRFCSFSTAVSAAAAGVVGRLPRRAVVHDDQLVVHVGVLAHRLDEVLGVGQVVPGQHDHRQLGLARAAWARAGAAPARCPALTPSRTSASSSVRRSQSKSRSTRSSPLVASCLASTSSLSSRRMALAMATGSRGGTTSAVSPSMAYSRQPPLSVVTSGTPQAMASRPGWQKPSNQLPTTNTWAASYSRPRSAWDRFLGAVGLDRQVEHAPGLQDRLVALPRPAAVAHAQDRVLLGAAVGVEHLAVGAAQLDHRPRADLGLDLVGRPVAVGQLQVDRGADALPAARLVVGPRVVQGVEHPAPGVLEAVEQVPVRLVVEHDDVERVAEARAERLDGGVAAHPGAVQDLVVGQVEGDLVAPGHQAVRELEHPSDPAVAAQVRLDEADSQTRGCRHRRSE